ncbi:MAG: ATP-binding cassette domain-containing protein [Burkholderiales bacterium]|nr:ATP-binding cassette domain-containing protein [Burkholderiales bacterium]
MSAPDLTVYAEKLSRQYRAHAAVRDVTLELRRGEILGFLGPNGAGKSTTMRMLTGNLAPSAGSVRICGIDLMRCPVSAKARIGYLPETPPLYRDLTVDEFLQLAARLHRVAAARVDQAVGRAKQRCGLSEAGRRIIATLSKGYQQRIGIAQAIVHDPEVVILDEPTVGLDPNQIREIRELIRELGQEASVILSTHILPEVEAVCDRVQIMHRGHAVFSGSIASLKQLRSAGGIEIALRAPPAFAEIVSIPGVAGADDLGDGAFRIRHETSDATDAVLARAVERRWGLFRLASAETSLEQVFSELTEDDVAA